jgi:hypothetical protein
MSGVEASVWIRMKRAWDRKPAVKERVDTLPTGMRTITAMPESAPPHLTYPMPEHGESASVTRYGVVLIETQTHTSQPCSDLCEWLVHPKAQRLLKLLQLCSHPRISRFSPDYEQATWGLPTHMGKSQKRERLGFSLSSRAPVLGGEPPELQQPRFLRMEFQPESSQALLKLPQEALGVLAVLKTNHQIISVTDRYHLPAGDLPPPSLYPKIENVMQVHVGEQW